ncbi:hypothetical protein LOL17_003942, partial [Acinetobacter baumannii]
EQLYLSSICATKPKETGHEYTIRTLVEQHNIAEAYTLKT